MLTIYLVVAQLGYRVLAEPLVQALWDMLYGGVGSILETVEGQEDCLPQRRSNSVVRPSVSKHFGMFISDDASLSTNVLLVAKRLLYWVVY